MDMSTINQRQRDIMNQLKQIRIMKKGSVTFQRYPVHHEAQAAGRMRGPYPVLTWKEEGRTKSIRLKTPGEVAWAQDAVENHKRFTALCHEYERLAEQLALGWRDHAVAASEEAGKKRIKSRKTPKRR